MQAPSGPNQPRGAGPVAQPSARHRSERLRRLGRDYAYILPGLPLAVFAFGTLIPLTAVSIGTAVIWVGVFLLVLTLTIASGFAGLSRARVRAAGVDLPPVAYRAPDRPGLLGRLRILTDSRRWLDLVFETFVALPLRVITFAITMAWTVGAAAGLTSYAWTWAIPGEPAWIQLLQLTLPDLVPDLPDGQYVLSAAINFVLGVIFLLTLPAVVGSLARVDLAATTALLGGAGSQLGSGSSGMDEAGRHPAGSALTWEVAFSGRAWTWLGVSFPAVVLVAVGWPVLAADYGLHPVAAMVLGVTHPAAAVLALRSTWLGIGLSTVAAAGTMVATAEVAGSFPWPWPVTSMLAHFLLVLMLALRHPWHLAWIAWATGTLLTLGGWLLVDAGFSSRSLATGIVLISVSATLAIAGSLIQLWTKNVGRVRQAETVSAEEARRRRELQNRNRIARELHDVVAHSMSVITVQATTARYRRAGIDAEIQQEFDEIAASSRRALAEMRDLLAILRGTEQAPTAPMPGAEQIDDLIEATRASGVSIHYRRGGAEVSPTVGLTAFRIVQEGLSNALRHSPGSAISVVVGAEGEMVNVDVENSAGQGSHAPVGSAPAHRKAERAEPGEPVVVDEPAAPGSGLGLTGLRERVLALGGSVQIGPTASGGFRIVAALPRHAD